MPRNSFEPLPPFISTSDPDSFASFTFTDRLPKMLDQIVEKNSLGGTGRQALIELKNRLRSGVVQDCSAALGELLEPAERAVWNAEIAGHVGRSWLDLPWYFAESLFYLEILLAWGYYSVDRPRLAADPFEAFKEEELHRPGGALDLVAGISPAVSSADTTKDKLRILLHYCLWANRMDLSYSQLLKIYRNPLRIEEDHLLVDHSDTVTEKLLQASRVDFILDNAASELICDLYLVHLLLQHSEKLNILLHCKKAPFYVSDAMGKDVLRTIASLEHSGHSELLRIGRLLTGYLEDGRLRILDHYFWNGPLHFPEFPDDLRRCLAGSDLVVLKGDVNYRRLLSDRRWAPSVNMESIVGYFPAALVTLRTTKSELVVDLSPEKVEELNRKDPKWMIEGRYGIIRYCESGNCSRSLYSAGKRQRFGTIPFSNQFRVDSQESV